MTFCTTCGKQLEDESNVCEHRAGSIPAIAVAVESTSVPTPTKTKHSALLIAFIVLIGGGVIQTVMSGSVHTAEEVLETPTSSRPTTVRQPSSTFKAVTVRPERFANYRVTSAREVS